MADKPSFLICILFLLPCLISSEELIDGCDPKCSSKLYNCSDVSEFNAAMFPKIREGETVRDFYFGGASSAYQVEGKKGREQNIWDSFTEKYKGDDSMSQDSGDDAINSYELYKDDVQRLKGMGANAYRFSIAWSRIFTPRPSLKGNRTKQLLKYVNKEGVAYYNNLIDELKNNNIEPFVTLFHWDLPQYLEDEYEGFLNRRIVNDFVQYAEFCFKTFGKKVKHWITLNQPYSYAFKGYGDGSYPPNRCSSFLLKTCVNGNSGTEPYIAAHHEILAHAEAVDLYRRKYKKTQGGYIGVSLITRWFEPYDDKLQDDIDATERAFDFFLGWFLEPMTKGDYPSVMKDLVGDRLPRFTAQEKRLIKNSLDFLGVNYYVVQYVKDDLNSRWKRPSVTTDAGIIYEDTNKDGVSIGEKVDEGFYAFPPGLKKILDYIKNKYGDMTMFITENGYKSKGEGTFEEIREDQKRIEFHCSHLTCLKCAIEKDSKLKVAGYFVWSNLDNYEFLAGFSVRFGMNYVDFKNPKVRKAKKSAEWFKKFNESPSPSPPPPPPGPSPPPPPPSTSPPPPPPPGPSPPPPPTGPSPSPPPPSMSPPPPPPPPGPSPPSPPPPTPTGPSPPPPPPSTSPPPPLPPGASLDKSLELLWTAI